MAEGEVSVDFLVDMAEIPTLQHRDDVEAAGEAAYARQSCESFADRLDLRVDGRALALAVASSDLAFRPGQAGLDTLRLDVLGVGGDGVARGGGEHRLTFASSNFTDRAGWREVTAVGDGTTVVASDVPAASVSDRLARLPGEPAGVAPRPADGEPAGAGGRSVGGRPSAAAGRGLSPLSRPASTGPPAPSPRSSAATTSRSASPCWPSWPRSSWGRSTPSPPATARR